MWWWGRATARSWGRRSATTASTCAGPIAASHPILAAQGASLSCQPLLIFSAAAAFFLLILFWYKCAAGRVSRGTTENLCRVHGFPSRRNSAMVRDETLSTTAAAAAASSSSAMGGATSSGIPVSGTGENIRYIGPGGMHSAKCTADLHRSCFCVRFIAEHTRLKEESLRVRPFLHLLCWFLMRASFELLTSLC